MEDKRIGMILSVKGTHVIAKLDKVYPPYLIKNGFFEPAPKINTYVKTKVGLLDIVCLIIGENYELRDDSNNGNKKIDGYFIDMNVVGTIEQGTFSQGIRCLPIVQSEVFILNDFDRKIIFSIDEYSILLGKNVYDLSKDVGFSVNKLIPSHVGIFGNTGSGKSNTLVKILSEYYNNFLYFIPYDIGRVLLFDINNEYGKDAIIKEKFKKVINLNTRKSYEEIDNKNKIPLDYAKLTEDDFVIFLNATQKTQAPVIKRVFDKMKKDFDINDYYNELKLILNNNQQVLFNTLRYRMNDYIKGLDEFTILKKHNIIAGVKGHSSYAFPDTNEFNDFFSKKISIIEPKTFIDKFLFVLIFQIAKESSSGTNSDFILPLISRCEKLKKNFKKIFYESNEDLFLNNNFVVIQLGNSNNDMLNIVPSIISKLLLDNAIEKKGDLDIATQITNIVIDEAHNILFEDKDDNSNHKTVIDVFEKIVKEGRKFGVFLMLASQRPSDISNTIISQLHNYCIHKLVNPYDLQKIRKSVAYLDETSLDFLTVLSPGECLISGTAMKIPQFVKIDMVKKNQPLSATLELTEKKGIFKEYLDIKEK